MQTPRKLTIQAWVTLAGLGVMTLEIAGMYLLSLMV